MKSVNRSQNYAKFTKCGLLGGLGGGIIRLGPGSGEQIIPGCSGSQQPVFSQCSGQVRVKDILVKIP